jgi:hypothetical protein
MARGWESKSVEGQIEEAGTAKPPGSTGPLTDDEKKTKREQDSLKLSRVYVLHQIESSTNERYTESLRKALSEIEQKLAKLGTAG